MSLELWELGPTWQAALPAGPGSDGQRAAQKYAALNQQFASCHKLKLVYLQSMSWILSILCIYPSSIYHPLTISNRIYCGSSLRLFSRNLMHVMFLVFVNLWLCTLPTGWVVQPVTPAGDLAPSWTERILRTCNILQYILGKIFLVGCVRLEGIQQLGILFSQSWQI